ncbi:MAG: ABC transporter ATP-binding protein [Chloroflexi bacterium]|nr:ABC transporter ATP-binding protein [Chloroflexota bacterium]
MIDATFRRLRSWIVDSPRWLLVCSLRSISLPLTMLTAVCVLLNVALPTAFALLSGHLINTLPDAIEQGPGSPAGQQMLVAVVALGLTFLFIQIVISVRTTAANALGRRFMGEHTRRVMVATLAPPGLAHLEDPAYLDQVSRALATNRHDSQLAVMGLAAQAVTKLQGIVGLAIVAYFQWWLAVPLLLAMLHSARHFGPVRRGLVNMRMGKADSLRRANYLLKLTLRPEAAKEIRVFGLADWLVDRFQHTWMTAMAELWLARSSLWRTAAWAGLPVVIAQVVGLSAIGWATLNGTVDLGSLVVYVRALLLAQQLSALSDADAMIDHGTSGLPATADLERIAADEERRAGQHARPAKGLPQREIRFERVSFSYPGDRAPIFSDLDLTIAAGRTLAIVGENGAGKTTLVKLLARLYEPTAGRITADGIDLTDLDIRSWQRTVAAIFQDYMRYELPATDNVGFGAVERRENRAALVGAAQRANALDLIQGLPHGWDTALSRRFTDGTDLSGGQWQRIAMARALFAAAGGAGILVLDEPTAQLDVRAEAAFYDQFFDLTRGLTTIVISHRFSTVRRADRIVVLDGGRVVEDGSHTELLAAGGRYAEMFELQAARFGEHESSDAPAEVP